MLLKIARVKAHLQFIGCLQLPAPLLKKFLLGTPIRPPQEWTDLSIPKDPEEQ